MSHVKTSGQLRQLIIETMEGVKAGTVGLDAASRITKLAAQVNESVYAEIKNTRTQFEINGGAKDFVLPELGEMPLLGKNTEQQ